MEAIKDPGIYDACDEFIRKCKSAIVQKDVGAARRIRNEATAIFRDVVPGWHGGLTGQLTGFYLDDAEMILGKLSVFKANRYAVAPRDYVRLAKVVEKVMSTHELFETTLAAMSRKPCAQNPGFETIVARIREFQAIAESPLGFEERWELIKPFLHWLTTLDADVAEDILPLVVRGAK